VDKDDVIEAYNDILDQGFDVSIAAVLQEFFCEVVATIHSCVVVFFHKADDVETAGTK
jgi:hypothetical protein